MYNMLKIPVTARLTNGTTVKHVPYERRSPATAVGPKDAPLISEVVRIRILKQQKFWRNVANYIRTNPRPDASEPRVDT